ncbi:MAG: archease [Candidatus Nanohaloarchaea archaeon]|nr:archease [Candidatus Nanohaloarchaea archaeon]
MKQFEIIEHTAEVGFRAYGTTLEEAFENSGRALFSLMTDLERIEQDRELSFTLEAANREALLYDFLDHLLYLRDTEGMLFAGFDASIDEVDGGYRIHASIRGCDSAEIPAQDVKAPTYSDMRIEDGDQVLIQVILDV